MQKRAEIKSPPPPPAESGELKLHGKERRGEDDHAPASSSSKTADGDAGRRVDGRWGASPITTPEINFPMDA